MLKLFWMILRVFFVHLFLVLYYRERKVEPVADETAMMAEPFSPPRLIMNSIRDRLVALEPH